MRGFLRKKKMVNSMRQRTSSARVVTRKGEAPLTRSEQRRERRRAQRKDEQPSNVVQLKVAPQAPAKPVAKAQPEKVAKQAKAAKVASSEADVVAHVGKRIQLRRNQLNWSRETMAAKLKGVSAQGLQAIERGKREASASLLFRFSVELKVPVSFFYEDLPGFVNPIPGKLRAAVQTLQATLL